MSSYLITVINLPFPVDFYAHVHVVSKKVSTKILKYKYNKSIYFKS